MTQISVMVEVFMMGNMVTIFAVICVWIFINVMYIIYTTSVFSSKKRILK